MRFEKIVSVLPKCGLLAEVGCDHARLTELALRKGLCDSAVVSDISETCLAKARVTLRDYPNVTYIVADGVPEEARKADCIMICGMGGHTIADILSRYTGRATLVLSPQSHTELVRAELRDLGYDLDIDECFEAAGKFYDLLRAEKGDMTVDSMQIAYGKFYKRKNAALEKKLTRLLNNLKNSEEANAAKIREIEEVLVWQR